MLSEEGFSTESTRADTPTHLWDISPSSNIQAPAHRPDTTCAPLPRTAPSLT